jgi:hypothetical protein
MDTVILGVICVAILVVLAWVVAGNRKTDDKIRDSLLEIVTKLSVPAEIPIVEPRSVEHSTEYMPEVELDEWMSAMGMVPMAGGWGPPGGTIPEESLPPTELPEP